MRPSSSAAATRLLASTVMAALVTACGGGHEPDTSPEDDPRTPVIVEITEDSGDITPDDAEVVTVDRGQAIKFVVTSDVDDEIHVHSEPEQEFEIAAGDSETFEFTIAMPGQYEVESHSLELVLVKLQVS